MNHGLGDNFEIGFIPLDWYDKGGITVYGKVDLKEISVPSKLFMKLPKGSIINAEIPVEGEVDLEAYKKNPIVTLDFNEKEAVGKVIEIKQESNKLLLKIKLKRAL